MYLQTLIFSFVFSVAPDSPPLVPDNELVHDDINDIGPLSSKAEPYESPRATSRQRAVAQVRPISVSQVSTLETYATSESGNYCNFCNHCNYLCRL